MALHEHTQYHGAQIYYSSCCGKNERYGYAVDIALKQRDFQYLCKRWHTCIGFYSLKELRLKINALKRQNAWHGQFPEREDSPESVRVH